VLCPIGAPVFGPARRRRHAGVLSAGRPGIFPGIHGGRDAPYAGHTGVKKSSIIFKVKNLID